MERLKLTLSGILVALALSVPFASLANAQGIQSICVKGTGVNGQPSCQDVNNSFPFPVSATASIGGFPGTTQTTGTPLAVTAASGTATLPAGTVVVVTNVGTTNIAFCKLGASSTTADQAITPNGGWFAFTVGSNTQLSCITSTSITTVNLVGGAGLPTGTGGGGGGSGGGGVVTQPTASLLNATVVGTGTFAVQAAQSGTWNVTNISGTISLPTGAATSALQTTGNASLASILTAVTSPVPLGTAGGWTPKRLNGLSTTVTAIKSSSAGQLGLLHCDNPNASIAYVQVFDVATAGGVTLGTTVSVLSFALPATNASGYSLPVNGIQFANGIQVAATTTATGLTAPGTALDCNAAFN